MADITSAFSGDKSPRAFDISFTANDKTTNIIDIVSDVKN